jgi:hypothetical protein
MADFSDFLRALEDGTKDLAKKTLKGFTPEALRDSKEFLRKTEEDLKRWTKLLASGELTQEDFEWLVLGKKDLAELHALKEAGIAVVRIDRFRNALMDLTIDTALDVFL